MCCLGTWRRPHQPQSAHSKECGRRVYHEYQRASDDKWAKVQREGDRKLNTANANAKLCRPVAGLLLFAWQEVPSQIPQSETLRDAIPMRCRL